MRHPRQIHRAHPRSKVAVRAGEKAEKRPPCPAPPRQPAARVYLGRHVGAVNCPSLRNAGRVRSNVGAVECYFWAGRDVPGPPQPPSSVGPEARPCLVLSHRTPPSFDHAQCGRSSAFFLAFWRHLKLHCRYVSPAYHLRSSAESHRQTCAVEGFLHLTDPPPHPRRLIRIADPLCGGP